VGAIDTVRTLLDLGIDTSLKSQHGTALDVAKRAKHRVRNQHTPIPPSNFSSFSSFSLAIGGCVSTRRVDSRSQRVLEFQSLECA